MPAYLLSPACKDYLWGGRRRLREDFGVQSTADPLAEAWVLSCHPDGSSVVADGPWAGRTLRSCLEEAGTKALGTHCDRFRDFPVLIKLIDAERELSIQVHPSDEYARTHEGQYGKTEMWVALKAEPHACLYYGFEREVSREEYAAAIAGGTLTELLHRVPVQQGDVFFIPAGTLHAIGAGLVMAEIQQNSNVTYRVYDYNRVGADGKPRPLHVEKALEVTDLHPVKPLDFGPHLGMCDSFVVDRYDGDFQGCCGEESFHALLVARGQGTLDCGGESREVRQGNCLFLPAGSGEYRVRGNCQTLATYIP